jgi:hypothetical protein
MDVLLYGVSNTVSTVAPDHPGAVLPWGGDVLREALGCWPITRTTRLSRWHGPVLVRMDLYGAVLRLDCRLWRLYGAVTMVP